jgi:hypothetical protein
MLDGTEPIADDEELYRRIPVSTNWYDPDTDAPPSPRAFRPHEDRDGTGLSLYRGKFCTPREVAQNDRGKQYYIAVLRAGDLRAHGIEITPAPIPPDKLGHAELPGLRADNRRDTEETQMLLAERLSVRIEGPFPASEERA